VVGFVLHLFLKWWCMKCNLVQWSVQLELVLVMCKVNCGGVHVKKGIGHPGVLW